MDRIFQVVGWIVAAVLGVLVWTVFPEAQTFIACLLAGSAACYVLFAAVKVTVQRIIGDELMELRLQSNAVANRLEHMDRKITVILRDALERRQAANPRDAVRSTLRQGHVAHRRSA